MKKVLILLMIVGMSISGFAQLKEAKYKDGNQVLNGLFNGSAGKGKPGVLILPAWMGIDDEAKEAAEQLSKAGYLTFIADIYGEGNSPKSSAEAGKLAGSYKKDYVAYQKRIQLALAELIKMGADEKKLAVIGYCFGGTGALETARGVMPVNGVVSIHGGLSKGDRPNGELKTKILVLHGAADASVSEQDLVNFREEVDVAKADWQMIFYADAKHTFTNPKSPDYLPIAANRSWKHTLVFLEELFQ